MGEDEKKGNKNKNKHEHEHNHKPGGLNIITEESEEAVPTMSLPNKR